MNNMCYNMSRSVCSGRRNNRAVMVLLIIYPCMAAAVLSTIFPAGNVLASDGGTAGHRFTLNPQSLGKNWDYVSAEELGFDSNPVLLSGEEALEFARKVAGPQVEAAMLDSIYLTAIYRKGRETHPYALISIKFRQPDTLINVAAMVMTRLGNELKVPYRYAVDPPYCYIAMPNFPTRYTKEDLAKIFELGMRNARPEKKEDTGTGVVPPRVTGRGGKPDGKDSGTVQAGGDTGETLAGLIQRKILRTPLSTGGASSASSETSVSSGPTVSPESSEIRLPMEAPASEKRGKGKEKGKLTGVWRVEDITLEGGDIPEGFILKPLENLFNSNPVYFEDNLESAENFLKRIFGAKFETRNMRAIHFTSFEGPGGKRYSILASEFRTQESMKSALLSVTGRLKSYFPDKKNWSLHTRGLILIVIAPNLPSDADESACQALEAALMSRINN